MKLSNAKIKEADLIEFYKHCEGGSSIEQFREYCKRLVSEARAPNQEIIRQIDTMSRKQLIFAINNFIMKGHGFGVI